jgi:kynureninase
VNAVRREDCEARDGADPLAPLREFFEIPDGLTYLAGNSLGPPPLNSVARVLATLRTEWGEGLVRSWEAADWWDKPVTLGGRIAPLVGARPDEVLVGDSTSVNLFKVAVAAMRLRADRRVIVTDRDNFPTDLYMLEAAAELAGGAEVRRVDDAVALADCLDESVALVELTHVDYRLSRRHPMDEITRAVHDAGALMVWDLAHSVGAVPVALDDCDVDFAVGSTYKYLNGGPGSPAFVFAAARLHEAMRQPLVGWHGHVRPFAFEPDYAPAPGIRQFACGSPPIVAFASLEGSLEVWQHVEPPALFAKGQALCDLFIELVEPCLAAGGLELVSPRDPARRGSHVALRHPGALAIVDELARRGVLGDFRAPDIIRLGIAPLYLRYVDIWDAAAAIRAVLASDVPGAGS